MALSLNGFPLFGVNELALANGDVTFDDVRRKESDVLRLERIVMREFGTSTLRFRFSGQRRIVDLRINSFNRV